MVLPIATVLSNAITVKSFHQKLFRSSNPVLIIKPDETRLMKQFVI